MTQNHTNPISSQEFIERIVLGKRDALVRITSAWNGAGQMLSHVVDDLATLHPDVHFFSMDYDAESAMVSTYRVEDVPTILFFKKGTLVDRLSGLVQKSVIAEKINKFIQP